MSTSPDIRVPFMPQPLQVDLAAERFADFRRAGLRQLGTLLTARLSGQPAESLLEGLREAADMPAGRWMTTVLSPLFSCWWTRIGGALQAADPAALAALAVEFPEVVKNPTGAVGRVPRTLGLDIPLDASHPLVVRFLASENDQHPSPGRSHDDLEPAAVSGKEVEALSNSIRLLGQAWPAMENELRTYVRLIVPFHSAVRAAFTNVAWQGAIFLRTTFNDPVANVERLVHETSHLRLNMVMALCPLHTHARADRVPSPFRAGQRPVNGLYHGAFVVTRAAYALAAVHRAGGDDMFADRVPVLLAQVDLALATLYRDVRLTPAGRDLLDQVRSVADDLSATYGLADPTEPTIYAEL